MSINLNSNIESYIQNLAIIESKTTPTEIKQKAIRNLISKFWQDGGENFKDWTCRKIKAKISYLENHKSDPKFNKILSTIIIRIKMGVTQQQEDPFVSILTPTQKRASLLDDISEIKDALSIAVVAGILSKRVLRHRGIKSKIAVLNVIKSKINDIKDENLQQADCVITKCYQEIKEIAWTRYAGVSKKSDNKSESIQSQVRVQSTLEKELSDLIIASRMGLPDALLGIYELEDLQEMLLCLQSKVIGDMPFDETEQFNYELIRDSINADK